MRAYPLRYVSRFLDENMKKFFVEFHNPIVFPGFNTIPDLNVPSELTLTSFGIVSALMVIAETFSKGKPRFPP
jgi:hypothetical protein